MVTSGRPRSNQLRACSHARPSTQLPIVTIWPESSATGMKSAGGTDPRVGWVQRSSASAPMIAPVLKLIFGW